MKLRCAMAIAWIPGALAAVASAQTVSDPALTVSPVVPVFTLNQPTQVRFLGIADLLVTEKGTGRIQRIVNGSLLPAPVLDLDVCNENERGLIGLALDPAFDTNHYAYVTYSATTGGDGGPWLENRLSRLVWDGTSFGSELVLKTFGSAADGQEQGPNHDGGPIRFGPDNMLYGVAGDLNRNRAEQNNLAQASLSALVGGVYRLTADGVIPPDNPFASSPTAGFRRWFGYGVRNSYGLAFDPLTGNVWDTENGPDAYDEINRVASGFNSGWYRIMGPVSRDPEGTSDLVQLPGSAYSDPEFSFFNTIAITGLAFLANSSFGASYQDALLVGDFNFGQLYLFRLNANRDGFVLAGGVADRVADDATERDAVRFGSGFGGIADVEIGPDGSAYVVDLGLGTVYRILPEPSALVMLGVGSIALACAPRRRSRRAARA
jgi:glucose/arabinose dehydrogenase